MKSFLKCAIGIVAAALLLAAAPARATLFTLTQWNTSQFEAAGASVTVMETFDGTNTILDVVMNQGTLLNAFLGFDKFGYQSSTGCCLAGSTAGWTPFSGSGMEDGFGTFAQTGDKGGGTDLTLHFIIAGNVTADLNSADDFAGHARFAGIPVGTSCSGFFGGHDVPTTDEPGCGSSGVRQTTPEPGTLLLLGIGLLGAAVGARRKPS